MRQNPSKLKKLNNLSFETNIFEKRINYEKIAFSINLDKKVVNIKHLLFIVFPSEFSYNMTVNSLKYKLHRSRKLKNVSLCIHKTKPNL